MRRGLRVTEHDETLFSRARWLAVYGQHHRVRVGAILAKGRRTVASASNRAKDFYGEPFKEGHAERLVIEGVSAMKGTLYVVRLDLSGALAPSWPCSTCEMYIRSCECVSKICYFDGQAIVKVRL
jgi:deoxycytidylate deaminase